MSDHDLAINKLAAEGGPDRVQELAQLFPEAMTDGKVDIEKLRLLLGEKVEESQERYGLTWPGKRDAIRLAQKQSTATLAPMRDDSVDWNTTKNLIIEGDNLEVLKLLQKSYYGKVKLIYIDPPYNTGKDFVYPDDFSEPTASYLGRSGQIDGSGFRTSINKETSGRFHSDWLGMMYSRLVLARNLLAAEGSIFISIDDIEIANLRLLLDETFGSENLLGEFIWKSKSGGANDSGNVAVDHEYVLAYAKSLADFRLGGDKGAVATTNYSFSDNNGRYSLERLDKQNLQYSASLDYVIEGPDGEPYVLQHKDPSRPNAIWRWSKRRVEESRAELVFRNGNVYAKNYEKSEGKVRSLWVDERFGRTRTGRKDQTDVLGSAPLDNAKPLQLIEFITSTATFDCGEDIEGPVILDFFAGSGTTAHAVMAQNAEDGGNRRFILVQLPEATDNPEFPVISDITRERVRRAGKKIKEEAGLTAGDLDTGFRAFKLSESNFKNWDADAETLLAEDLEAFVNNINTNASDDGIIHEILLKAGIPLDSDMNTVTIAGAEATLTLGGAVLVSANRKITQEFIDGILALDSPVQEVYLLDSGFGDDDTLKVNSRHQFAARQGETNPDKNTILRTV